MPAESGGSPGEGGATVERVVLADVWAFSIGGTRLFWLSHDASTLSLSTSALDGSEHRVIVQGLSVSDYAYELAATSTRVYYMSATRVYEVDPANGATEEFPIPDVCYRLFADEVEAFVVCNGGTYRFDGGVQQKYSDAHPPTVTQDEDSLYWMADDRVAIQAKRGATGPIVGPSLGTDQVQALAAYGRHVYALTSGGLVRAALDDEALPEVLIPDVASVAESRLIVRGDRIYCAECQDS